MAIIEKGQLLLNRSVSSDYQRKMKLCGSLYKDQPAINLHAKYSIKKGGAAEHHLRSASCWEPGPGFRPLLSVPGGSGTSKEHNCPHTDNYLLVSHLLLSKVFHCPLSFC